MDNYLTTEDVRELVRTTISRQVRSGDLDVPMLPHVAQQVMSLTSSPSSSASDFVQIIEQDQHLATKLLKIANSPVYAGRVEVTSIQRAIVSIGMQTLRDLVFGVAMGERIFRSKLFHEPMTMIWDHSLATAYIARELATLKRSDPEYAFMCGLLHDVGKPLLLSALETIHRKYQDRVYFTKELIDEVMRDFHAQVGGLVARSWNFPEQLHAAIRYHHEFREAGDYQEMAMMMEVANLMAHYLGMASYMEEPEVDLLSEPALHKLELPADKFDALLKSSTDRVRELITSFNL